MQDLRYSDRQDSAACWSVTFKAVLVMAAAFGLAALLQDASQGHPAAEAPATALSRP